MAAMMRTAAGRQLLHAPLRRCFSSGAAVPALPSDAWARQHLSPAVAFLLRSGPFAPESVKGTGRAGRILKGDVLQAIKDGSIKSAPAEAHAASHAAEAAPAAALPSYGTTDSASSGATTSGSGGRSTIGRRDRSHTDIPLTSVRKVIASRLSSSKQSIPHAYAATTLRMDAVLKLREQWKQAGRASVPSVNDFIIRASALALRQVPAANATYGAQGATPSQTVDISVAVATPGGLITPIVRKADSKRLDSIGAEVKELAGRAKANKLKPEEFQGGSFTISNLGMFGVSSFSAIINPPQVCILAVGSSVQKVDEEAAGRMVAEQAAAKAAAAAPAPATASSPAAASSLPFARSAAFASPPAVTPAPAAAPVLRLPTSTYLTVTLVSDERAVDGETSAHFLAAFKGFMENPLSMQ